MSSARVVFRMLAGVLLPLILVAGGRGADGVRGQKPTPVLITQEDNHRTLTVPVGTPLRITLQGRPGTGFGWYLLHGDSSVLKPVGTPKTEDPKPEQKLDGIELTVFRFKAVRRKSCTLEFVYRRSWERGVPPAETFTVEIIVDGKRPAG